jgi:aspartate racemase
MVMAGGGCRIGVLGGIGPEATGYFYNKLIRGLQERNLVRNNRDFPQIVINSIPAPELIHDRISESELKPYLEGLKQLDIFGVDFIAMVCNTVHLHYETLQRGIRTPILDLREEVKCFLAENRIKSALVIGTPSTIKRGLYRFDGIRMLEPGRHEMKQLSESIFEFNKGDRKGPQIQNVRETCRKYLRNGAEAVILGCTEFAVMLDGEAFPRINTIDILVDATIKRFLSYRNSRG